MMKKLITWKQFEEKFRPKARTWDDPAYHEYVFIVYNKFHWTITKRMKELFGTYIEVEECGMNSYTHYGINDISDNFYWHELWFEEFEFIKEEEMML